MSDLLQTFLHDRDVPCPNCAYNLRDLTVDRCPECGLQVVLGVHLTEPKLAAFITGLIGLAMAAGFSGLLAMAGFAVGQVDTWTLAMLVCALIATPILLIWVRVRPWLRRTGARRRRLSVLTCWLITTATFLVFILSIHYY